MVMGTVRYDILSLKPGNQREAEDPKKSDLPDVRFWLIGDDDIDANADDDEDWMMMKLMLGDGDIDDDNGDDIDAKADDGNDNDFDQFFSLIAVYHQLIQIDINNLKISRTIPHHPHISTPRRLL